MSATAVGCCVGQLETAGLVASKVWVRTTCLSLLVPESGLSTVLPLGYNELLLPVKTIIFWKAED